MRTLLPTFLVMATILHGGEALPATMSEKLHAKIMASAAPVAAQPAKDGQQKEATPAPVVVMSPLVVAGSTVVREVVAAVARTEEYRVAEKFSPREGGTIYSGDRLQIGSWWEPGVGWTFIRMNKRPSPYQIKDIAERTKELKELLRLGQKPPPK